MNEEGRIGLIPANYVELYSASNVTFRAVALHDYNSQGGEELSFVQAQILDIIQRWDYCFFHATAHFAKRSFPSLRPSVLSLAGAFFARHSDGHDHESFARFL